MLKKYKDITYLIAFIKEISISKLLHCLKGTTLYQYIKDIYGDIEFKIYNTDDNYKYKLSIKAKK